MVFSHHQLLGRSQQIPRLRLWPILLKSSSFPGNNSQYDQNQISLPILMYYIWDLQPKNKGWHKEGEKRARRKRKIEEPSSGLIWQMQSRKGRLFQWGHRSSTEWFFFLLLLLHQPRCRFVRLESLIKSSSALGQRNLWDLFAHYLEQPKDSKKKKKSLCWTLLASGKIPFGPN